jgi:hypothetical protein
MIVDASAVPEPFRPFSAWASEGIRPTDDELRTLLLAAESFQGLLDAVAQVLEADRLYMASTAEHPAQVLWLLDQRLAPAYRRLVPEPAGEVKS